jgi:molecular chaperone GrpE (heat shock protein)
MAESNLDEEDQSEKISEIVQKLQIAQTELLNYKKKMEDKKKKKADYNPQEEVVLRLMPIIENFELAMKNPGNPEFAAEMERVYDELMETLQDSRMGKVSADELSLLDKMPANKVVKSMKTIKKKR